MINHRFLIAIYCSQFGYMACIFCSQLVKKLAIGEWRLHSANPDWFGRRFGRRFGRWFARLLVHWVVDWFGLQDGGLHQTTIFLAVRLLVTDGCRAGLL